MAVFDQGDQEVGFEAADSHFSGLAQQFLADAESQDGPLQVIENKLGKGFTGGKRAWIAFGWLLVVLGSRCAVGCYSQIAQRFHHRGGAMSKSCPDAAGGLAVRGGNGGRIGHVDCAVNRG